MAWIRYALSTAAVDCRPVSYPPPGPYWIDDREERKFIEESHTSLVVFLPWGESVEAWWPDAEIVEQAPYEAIEFTEYFSPPDWEWAGEALDFDIVVSSMDTTVDKAYHRWNKSPHLSYEAFLDTLDETVRNMVVLAKFDELIMRNKWEKSKLRVPNKVAKALLKIGSDEAVKLIPMLFSNAEGLKDNYKQVEKRLKLQTLCTFMAPA